MLKTIDKKVKYNRAINYKAYEIVGKVVGKEAKDWLKSVWANRQENELLIFADAISKCFDFDEAFEILTNEIESQDDKNLPENISALLYFQSDKTLDWIEKVIHRTNNISTNWGTLAATSKFSWVRADKWLTVGRPLSLVAIDSLVASLFGHLQNMKEDILNQGFAIVDNIFTDEEISNLLFTISQVDTSRPTFRRTNDLFAIRQFFKEIPAAVDQVFNKRLSMTISEIFGQKFFVVKSIYFDKPENSNWFVSYHQDLTISVDKKIEIEGFGPWTTKQNQFAVQPPLEILKDNFTVRIHLDKTNAENGALRVIPKSHLKGVYRPETIDWINETETTCNVEKGGIMFMKPLLLHSSARTTNNNKRRVLHIEFSRSPLPDNLNWAERLLI